MDDTVRNTEPTPAVTETRLALPDFADDEARALEEEIIRLQKRLERSTDTLEGHRKATASLNAAAQKVSDEISSTQERLHKVDTDTELAQHALKLSECEIAQVRRQIREKHAEREAAEAAARSVANDIIVLEERRARLQARIQASEAELSSWREMQEAQADDVAAIERYAAIDDVKLRELEKAKTKLEAEVRALDEQAAVGDSEAALLQTRINRSADALAAATARRDEQLVRLERAVAVSEAREAAVAAAEARLAADREEMSRITEQITAKNEEIERTEEEKAEAEGLRAADVAAAEAAASAVATAETALSDATSALAAVRGEVSGLMTGLGHAKQERKAAKQAAAAAVRRLKHAQAAEATATDMLTQLQDRRMTLDEALAALAAQHRELEAEIKSRRAHLESRQNALFSAGNELSELHQVKAQLAALIGGSEATLRRLSARSNSLTAAAADQAAHLYDADYRLQRLQRQLATVRGSLVDDAGRHVRARCADLETQLEAEQQSQFEIAQQIAAGEADTRRTIAAAERAGAALARLDERVTALLAEARGAEAEIRQARHQLGDSLIDADDSELTVDELRTELAHVTEQAQAALGAVAERGARAAEIAAELSAQIDTDASQLRLMRAERATLMQEVASARRRAAGLTARYDVLHMRLERAAAATAAACDDGNDDELGEISARAALAAAGVDESELPAPVASQAQLLIRVTQRRITLRDRGDALDEAIRRGEATNAKLERQLESLTSLHRTHRSQFRPLNALPEGAAVLADLKRLESERAVSSRRLTEQRRAVARISGLLRSQETVLAEQRRAYSEIGQSQSQASLAAAAAKRDLSQKLQVLAEHAVALNEARGRSEVSIGELATEAVECALMQEHNRAAIAALLKIAQTDRIFAADLGRLVPTDMH